MKGTWLLLAAGAAFIGYKLISTAANLSYLFTSVKIDSRNTGLFKTTIEVTMRITNPGDTSLSFNRFTGSLLNNGEQVALIDIAQPVTIERDSQTDITFPVEASNLALLASLLDLVVNKSTPHVTIQGVLSAGSIRIPITQTIPVTLGQAIGTVPTHAVKTSVGLFELAI
jgi:LEA14-like dessication related protein